MEANEELDDVEINFGVGETENVEEETEIEETKEETKEEVEADKPEDTKEEKSVEPVQKKDSKLQALDYERARRKQAEKELKELRAEKARAVSEKEEAETYSKEKETLRAKLLEGDLIEEDIADKLLETLGDDIIKAKIAHSKRAEEENFEKDFAELKKDDMYMDADNYKDKIKEFVKKGLSLEEAYGAAIPASRHAQLKKDLEIEIEQKILNNDQKADDIDIGHTEAKGEAKRTSYTKEEQMIARETGLDVKEVHKRMNMNTLDEFLEL